MFHLGCLSLNLVQILCKIFCKENDSLVNWNEIKDFLMSHLIIILVTLLLSLHLFQQLICSENCIKSKFPTSFLLIKD
jgi:lipid-A-disaccharide synthase-like uncharacterized protein